MKQSQIPPIFNEKTIPLMVKGIAACAQVLRTPFEPAVLEEKTAGLTGENWMLACIQNLKNFDAKWKLYKTTKSLKDFPLPLILTYKEKLCCIVGKNDTSFLLYFPDENKTDVAVFEEIQNAWDGYVFLIKPKFKLDTVPARFGLHWFLPVFWKFKSYFYEILAASFVLQLFMLAMPLFTQVIIDKVLVHRGYSTLDVLVIGMIGVALFRLVLGYIRTYLFAMMTNKVDVILGTRLYNHIMSLSMRYFESHRVGETIARVKELENVRSFVSGSSLTLILDTAFCFVFIIVMFWYHAKLACIALVSLPLLVLLTLLVTPVYRQKMNKQFEATAENQSFLVESVTGISTVKTLALDETFKRRWNDLLGHYVKTTFTAQNIANIANSCGAFIQETGGLLILWAGAHFVMDGEMSVGQLIAFQMLSGQVSGPVLRLVGVWQHFQQVRVSIDRIGDILNLPSEYANGTSNAVIRKGDILFDNVHFKYKNDLPDVLKGIKLRINAGATVGIVGPSGSGKSTLAKLLQNIYEPDSGAVLVDGVDIKTYDKNFYRRQIGSVLQENFLFHGTIRENIRIASPGATDSQVEEAARMSGALEFISKMKDGLDTMVEERGGSLSGGQRQKIAISRALLTNPKIMVFDEATSALDAISEKDVMQQINRVREGRTVLLITHRLSSVRNTDMILVMFDGKIVEHGTHETLMEQNGLYANMYRQQES
jgi:subfamily B ATP-binding cassette protein HlyB/CyaB